MAEVIGIVAAAIAFAQATASMLDALNNLKDAPKYIQELHRELQDLEAVLIQIDSKFSCQQGDPVEAVLRNCSATLKQLHDLVTPLQEIGDSKLKKYAKGLHVRLKEGEIEGAVKRLQSQKLTLTIALIAGAPQSVSLLYCSYNNIDATTEGLIGHIQAQEPHIIDMRR